MIEDLLCQIENSLNECESRMKMVQQNFSTFENQEANLDKNLQAAQLNQNMAFISSTLYLSNKKLDKTLKGDDEILLRTKKIMQKQERVGQVERNLERHG